MAGGQTLKTLHASETNFVTEGCAAVCKAEKQGLKQRQKDRENWHMNVHIFFLKALSQNIKSLRLDLKIPSETKHTH